MKYLLLLLAFISVSCFAQEKKTVIVPPSKDTTVIEFTTTTVTTATTTTGYTTTVKPTIVKTDSQIVTTPVYGTLVYSLDFSKAADLDPFGNNQFGRGSIVDGKFKAVPANVSSGIRSEVQFPESLTPKEGVIEYDVMYETIFQNSGHSLQFHPNTSGGSASPGLWHENGKWVWANWKGGTNTKYPTNTAIPQGKWMHVVFEYKMGSAGYMKFTVDGKVLLERTGIQVGDNSGAYLKVGTNQWVSAPSVVWYDNIKIWRRG